MPRFFFDTDDDSLFVRDEVGTELPDIKAAEYEAICTIAAIAKDTFALSGGTQVVINIRDERGNPVFEAEVQLIVHRRTGT